MDKRKNLLIKLILFSLILAGCAQSPSIVPEPTTAVAPSLTDEHGSTGSLFRNVKYKSYYRDDVPAGVGDTLTVIIQEKVSSSLSEETKGSRNASHAASFDASASIPFFSADGELWKAQEKMNINGSNTLNGKGGQANVSTFTTSIAVTVIEVLPNGYLRVSGEKQVQINKENEKIRLSGTLNPKAIMAGNVVSSTKLSDIRLEQITKGEHKLFTNPGWLTRFFMMISPI